MTRPPIIRAAGLTKRFGTFTAVDDLSFEVAEGSIFAFLGANGSGKSTTIRMLIGLLRPTHGTVEVDGIDVVRTPRRVRDHIGYMGQRVSLYQGLTLRENLEFYAGLYGLAGTELERRWGALAERFALRESENERASDLPAGVRQRAGLALSTLHRPRVLFLDEPTAGVDVENRLRFWDLIQDEAQAGVTVFVTTHFLDEVEYCDWACFIDAGRLIANAEPDVIRERHSEGYRVTLDVPAAARAEVARTLVAAGASPLETPSGLQLQMPALSPAFLDALGRIGDGTEGGRVHIEQPEMTRVFHRLMVGGARERSTPREAGTGARTAVASPAERGGALRERERPRVRGAGAAGRREDAPGRALGGSGARWRRLRTLMQREARATLRDPFTITILIGVPLAALLAFGFTLSTEVTHLRLGVHDANGTAASRRLIAELAANRTFEPRPYATRAELDRALVSGTISAALVIPPDFDRALRATGSRPPEIQVLFDGAETVLAGNAEAFLQGIVTRAGAALVPNGQRGGTEVVVRALFNPDFDGTPFMVAGTYGFVLTFLTTLITAVSIVNERVMGTFEQLQVTPATAAEIVLGKLLPLGAVFALDVLLMFTVAGVLLGVWPAGSAVFFLAVASFYVLISLAVGLIISATSATAAAAVQKTVLLSVPLIFLGGFAFPVRNMPAFFQWLAELIPATHFIRVSRAIYLRAEGPLELAPTLVPLALFAVVLMLIAFRTVETRA